MLEKKEALPRPDGDGPRTDELLFRFVDDSESLTSIELLELAAAILEKSLAKQKYRHATIMC